ncbi:large subunit ribosomal protein L7/L12 [Aureococcus anophagefferens]|uniref:Large subunit ribosomal protein L7/L12 n=1 Tax=Aureococcus anophagefferens TaxID=44056 RepID=A0ABR1G1J3_AURAN
MAFALRTARTVAARAAPRRAARCARSFCAPAASPKVQQLCDDVCQLNVLELNDAGGDAAAPAEAVEEKEYFDIKLTGFDAEAKIKVIKEVRALTGLGLKEAKEAVEGAPSVLKKEVKKDEAEEILKKLAELGATAELE